MTAHEIVEVYTAADVSQAYFLRDMLRDAGIGAEVVGEALLSGVPVGEATAPRLWVKQGDEERARQLLAEWEKVQQRPHPDDVPAETWKCSTCGEEVEADFDLCWNCQTPRKPW